MEFQLNRMKLAILSPNENAYSETFIQAHRKLIRAEKFYYHGGSMPTHLEGKELLRTTLLKKGINKLKNKILYQEKVNLVEEAFYNSLKKQKINVVLAEYGPTAVAVLAVCKKLNIPLVVHFHGFDASSIAVVTKYGAGYKSVFDYASSIVSVSKVMTNMLKKMGAPEDKIVLNAYGPNGIFFENKPDFLNNDFLAVGRFVEKKAPYYTILAFRELVDSFPDAKLLYAGEGPLLGVCKNLTRYLRIEDKVIFLGRQSHAEVKDLMNSVTGFVQHSITSEDGDMEGAPVAIIEASAAGLPVVSTFHAGIPEVIIHEKTGFLVEEHSVTAMAEYMKALLEKKEIAQRMGEEGKKHIRQNLSMDKHIETLEEILKKAVNKVS